MPKNFLGTDMNPKQMPYIVENLTHVTKKFANLAQCKIYIALSSMWDDC